MAYRSGLAAVAAAILAIGISGCATSQDDQPISQRAGRAAAASVPAGASSSSTVRGGLSSPTGP